MPGRAWKRLSAGDGAKGPRLYDWAWLPFGPTRPGLEEGPADPAQIAKPDEFTFYLTLSPEEATLADLVRVAGTRWTIEACFEAAKGEIGLDQYEVRSWTGWHRHITFAMLAHAYLAVLRRAAVGGEVSLDLAADLLPLTVPEVRLLWRLVWIRSPNPKAASPGHVGVAATSNEQGPGAIPTEIAGFRDDLAHHSDLMSLGVPR